VPLPARTIALAIRPARSSRSLRRCLDLWQMRSSACTPTGLELDTWIVANALVEIRGYEMLTALVSGFRSQA